MFAYLYGSFHQKERYRDIDVGIYMDPEPDLLKVGEMTSELNKKTRQEIDLVMMNRLPARNPELAFQIVSRGKLLFTRDEQAHNLYKEKTLKIYYDTAYLRKQIKQAFDKRIEEGKFGERDYAS